MKELKTQLTFCLQMKDDETEEEAIERFHEIMNLEENEDGKQYRYMAYTHEVIERQ